MSGPVRQTVTALLLIAWLAPTAVAGPEQSDPIPHDRDGTARAPDQTTPWIDQAPTKLFESMAEQRSDHRLAATLTLGGFYAGFVTWSYFAWYRNAETKDFKWGGDGNWRLWEDSGWFGPKTYAGGADKLGHAWATYGLARGGTELLYQWGGYSKLTSSIIAAALSEALFFGVEIKDGFHYEFSFGDLSFNTGGALLAVLLSNYPRADELIDFRVEYWPSKAYVRQFEGGNVNIAEDYSGQTYLLALHLGGIPALRESKYGSWSRFVDVVGGFETRGYKPDPPEDATGDYTYSQRAYFGLSLNAQGVFDWLLEGRSKPARKITHGLFEVFNAPYGSFGIVDGQRNPDGKPDGGGA
jgi:hypothetical protein